MRPGKSLSLLLLLTSLASLLAGCASPAADGDAAPTGAAVAEPSIGNATTDVELYVFQGLVVGASPSNPTSPSGPFVDALPVAKVETFTMPEAVTNLTFKEEVHSGTGIGRIEVYGPDGAIVYAGHGVILVGAPGVGSAGLVAEEDYTADGPFPAGEYEVRYYVGGALECSLEITGKVPGGSSPAGAEPEG